MVAELVPVAVRFFVLSFLLLVGCAVADTHGYGSNSASAPTLANFGNSCCGTAGSCVLGSSAWDRFVLDEVDDVDVPGGGHSCSGKLRKWYDSEEAWLNWSLMGAYDGAADQQVSEDVRISTDVVSNGPVGGVQLYIVLIVLCTGRNRVRITSALRGWSTEALATSF